MLLFLDFDGVLHPVPGSNTFDRACMSYLEELLIEFSVLDIVITSSWREMKNIDELRNYLGDVIGSRVIDVTPVIDEPFLKFLRFHEVMEYLEKNGMKDRPWCAIDDEIGNYPETYPVVFTNYRKGFTKEDANKLRTIVESQLSQS